MKNLLQVHLMIETAINSWPHHFSYKKKGALSKYSQWDGSVHTVLLWKMFNFHSFFSLLSVYPTKLDLSCKSKNQIDCFYKVDLVHKFIWKGERSCMHMDRKNGMTWASSFDPPYLSFPNNKIRVLGFTVSEAPYIRKFLTFFITMIQIILKMIFNLLSWQTWYRKA